MFGVSNEETYRRKTDPSSIPAEDIQTEVSADDGIVNIFWCVKGLGFGEIYLRVEDGRITHIESETMSREFVERVVLHALRQAPLAD